METLDAPWAGRGRLAGMGAVTRHGLQEPVPPALQHALRRAALEHATTERRLVHHLPLVHVGVPGREAVHPVRPDEPTDQALRADVVAAMVRRQLGPSTPLVWLTRPGELAVQDVDAAWLAGSMQAYDEAGLALVFVVVNRHGWLDPRSGLSRHWVRLRRR